MSTFEGLSERQTWKISKKKCFELVGSITPDHPTKPIPNSIFFCFLIKLLNKKKIISFFKNPRRLSFF
jgi:hypothetical protein